jgi:hypothetical protein
MHLLLVDRPLDAEYISDSFLSQYFQFPREEWQEVSKLMGSCGLRGL